MTFKLIIRRQGDAPDAAALDEHVFDEPVVSVGSGARATLTLSDPEVAPEQAIILDEYGSYLFLNRAVGTRLNGERLAREVRRPLRGGDVLLIGPYIISFVPGERTGAEKPRAAARATHARSTDARPPAGENAWARPTAVEEMSPAAPTDTSDGRAGLPSSLREIEEPSPAAPVDTDDDDSPPDNFAQIAAAPRVEEESSRLRIEDAARGGEGHATVEGVETLAERGTTAAQNGAPSGGGGASAVVLRAPTAPPPPAGGDTITTLPDDFPSPARKYFGRFTFTELALLAAGTLLAAAVIFLILEYA